MIISHSRFLGILLFVLIGIIGSQCKKATTDTTDTSETKTIYLDDSTYKLTSNRSNENLGDSLFIIGYVFNRRSDTTDYLIIRFRAIDSNYTIKAGNYITISPQIWFDKYDSNSCLIQFNDVMGYDVDPGQSIVVSDSAGKFIINLDNKVATSDMLKDHKRIIFGKLTL